MMRNMKHIFQDEVEIINDYWSPELNWIEINCLEFFHWLPTHHYFHLIFFACIRKVFIFTKSSP
jgi:hypothetical protein